MFAFGKKSSPPPVTPPPQAVTNTVEPKQNDTAIQRVATPEAQDRVDAAASPQLLGAAQPAAATQDDPNKPKLSASGAMLTG